MSKYKPFSELTVEEQKELLHAYYVREETIQLFDKYTEIWILKDKKDYLYPDFIYRIKPSEPEFNWDHAHPDYKYLARNKYGQPFLFTNKPRLEYDRWVIKETCPKSVYAGTFASYKPGTCDWKESLIKRPE